MIVEQIRRPLAQRLALAAAAAMLACVSSTVTVTAAAPRAAAPTPQGGESKGEQPGRQGSRNPQGNELQRMRRRFLADKYLREAETLEQSGKLDEARALLQRARQLAPENAEVRRRLDTVLSQLGVRSGQGVTYGEQMEALEQVRSDKAKSTVRKWLENSKEALDAGRYAEAIQLARQAEQFTDTVRDLDWGGLDDRAARAVRAAEGARDSSTEERARETERQILAETRRVTNDRLAFERQQVSEYLASATRAFRNQRFEEARDWAHEAIRIDPANTTARDLYDSSLKAVRESAGQRYAAEKARAYRREQEANERIRIVQSQILALDPKTTALAAKRAEGTRQFAAKEDPDDAQMRQRVQTETIQTSFTEETGDYNEVVRFIRTAHNVPIIITPEAATTISEESLTLVIDMVAPLTIANVLDQMVSKSEDLGWAINNGVVELTSAAKAGGETTLYAHDVRDLIFPMTSFTPPIIRDIPKGDSGVGGSRSGGQADEQVAAVDVDRLQEAIVNAVSWPEDLEPQPELTETGFLIVRANAELHRKVQSFLDDQRRFAAEMITIESKFLTITNNFLEQIGVDFRGLGGSGNKGDVATLDDVTNALDDMASRGFDNQGTGEAASNPSSGAFFNNGGDGDVRARTENYFASSLGQALSTNGGATAAITILDDLQIQALITAVQKRQQVQVVNSQLLSVLNNQRANVAVINQTSFVRDFDVEVAQASFIADPKVDVIQDGIVVDVQPTVSYDRRSVMLSLQPTVAELVRPIPTFTTSLAGTTLPVTLQLPVLTVRSFATQATVPDGGSVLLGGLREVVSRERRASVPILSKLPLISFFFKQEGIVDENTSLTVLVTATINDVREMMDQR